jgi:trans-aconitate methyltransferase
MTGGWASYFDDAAAGYDDDTAQNGWYPNHHARETLDALGLTPARVLDLGAGTGQTAEVLAGLYPSAELTLVDGSAAMAEVARIRLPSARVIVSDADSFLATGAADYDLVTAVGFLEMVPDIALTIAAAAARLTPGGHLLVTHEPLLADGTIQSQSLTLLDGEQDRSIRRYAATTVERAAVDAGLVRVVSDQFVAYHRGDILDPVVYELVVWVCGSARDAG